MRERLDWKGTNFVTDPLWGDNGKGKIVDLMAQEADIVVRVNGGPNAGHTVRNKQGEFALHLVPSGIFNPSALCVLADTVVVNPTALVDEINSLKKAGVTIDAGNLLISKRAHLIMPWHIERDKLKEIARGGNKIGTTGKGIGPVYSDRANREGLLVGNLLSPDFEQKFDRELLWQEKLTSLMVGNKIVYDKESILDDLNKAKDTIGPMITNVLPTIRHYHDSGMKVLGEAGQGFLLDLDRGGYPYVTSSHPGVQGFSLATGIAPKDVERVIGVTKVYTTRVGEGPLPTELLDEVGQEIRDKGKEYGATTGRPRRCGWLDIPALRYGTQSGGIDALVLTKLDVFDSFDKVAICVGYNVGGREYKLLPDADNEFMMSAKPILKILPGWNQDTSSCRSFGKLPENAKKFVKEVERLVNIPIQMVSVGPSREETIVRNF